MQNHIGKVPEPPRQSAMTLVAIAKALKAELGLPPDMAAGPAIATACELMSGGGRRLECLGR